MRQLIFEQNDVFVNIIMTLIRVAVTKYFVIFHGHKNVCQNHTL